MWKTSDKIRREKKLSYREKEIQMCARTVPPKHNHYGCSMSNVTPGVLFEYSPGNVFRLLRLPDIYIILVLVTTVDLIHVFGKGATGGGVHSFGGFIWGFAWPPLAVLNSKLPEEARSGS